MSLLKTLSLILMGCIFNNAFIASADSPIKYLCPDIRPTQCANVSGPTCGYFSQSTGCLTPPCSQKFKNPCEACSDTKVEAISCGECYADESATDFTIKIIKNKFKLPLCLDVNLPNVPKEIIH